MTFARLLLIAGLAAACARADAAPDESVAAPATEDTTRPWRKPGDKIDSILPMAEYLRRFRAGLVEPAGFSDGESSRERLARRFLIAVTSRDTASFADLVITRAEFAWLVFPDHIYASAPYDLDPELFWMQLTSGSAKGLSRSLDRLGGLHLTFDHLDCRRDSLQIKSGPVTVWSPCDLRYREGDRVWTRRLFGSMVERDGRVKLMSFANDF